MSTQFFGYIETLLFTSIRIFLMISIQRFYYYLDIIFTEYDRLYSIFELIGNDSTYLCNGHDDGSSIQKLYVDSSSRVKINKANAFELKIPKFMGEARFCCLEPPMKSPGIQTKVIRSGLYLFIWFVDGLSYSIAMIMVYSLEVDILHNMTSVWIPSV